MVKSFFESIKYVGHLIPLSFLRIFLGYYYFQQSLLKYTGDYLTRPHLADKLTEWLQTTQAPHWIRSIAGSQIIPHWQVYAFIILGIEFAISISYLLGYVVRPTAVLAALLSALLLVVSASSDSDLYRVLVAVHVILAWASAGRCLGMDYYFFKRRRGLWW